MSDNLTVFQLAKEFGLKALELIDKVRPLDLKIKNHMSELTNEQVDRIRSFMSPATPTDDVKKKATVRRKAATDLAAEKANANVVRRSTVLVRTKDVAPETKESTEGRPSVEMEAESLAEPVMESAPVEMSEENAPTEESPFEGAPSAEENTVSAAPIAAAAPPAPVAPVVTAAPVPEAPRRPKYSVIRVVSAEPQKRDKPLIVEEAPKTLDKRLGQKTTAPKTFTDPTLASTGTNLIKTWEEEDKAKKKSSLRPRSDSDVEVFKSTDFLRRERVYQPKKKKLSLGQSFKKTQLTTAGAHKRVVEVDGTITVEAMARMMNVKSFELTRKLKTMGVEMPEEAMGAEDWELDLATAQLLAPEFNFEVRDTMFNEEEVINNQIAAEGEGGVAAEGEPRSPVITIMGHVDHGKTSLLDTIRRARVASGEAGGITQHIGAYTVTVEDAIKNLQSAADSAGDKKDKKKKREVVEKAPKAKAKGAGGKVPTVTRLTFLDTPGHEAFTAIRSRGAKMTDIVVLVVASNDGVMPQTKEAIEHAKAAEVPLIVAINKMDLPDANPDRVRQQLSEFGILSEDWGGDTIFVPLSAKTGDGVDKLLEMIQLQAEVLELSARKDGLASGTVIESRLDKGRGPVATVLIQAGTLKTGEFVVVGTEQGRVRAMVDDKGAQLKEAGPSTPVEIIGLSGVPEAGDSLNAMVDEKAARDLVEFRTKKKRDEANPQGATMEDVLSMMAKGDLKELAIILKADMKGSAEAIQAALMKIPANKIRLKILSTSVGAISSNDVLLASASKAVVVGFNVRPDNKAMAEAESRGVQVKTYDIIYNLIDEVRAAMEGLLAPTLKEVFMGRAEVRNVFNITKVGAVAGCHVVKGKIQRSNQVRLLRDNRVVYTGKLSGLKRFKDDAKEVAEGYECGMSIENYNDIKEGDVIEAFMIESSKGLLVDAPGATA